MKDDRTLTTERSRILSEVRAPLDGSGLADYIPTPGSRPKQSSVADSGSKQLRLPSPGMSRSRRNFAACGLGVHQR